MNIAIFHPIKKPHITGDMRLKIRLHSWLLFFSHPDYTVGSGISPDQPLIAGRGLLPPVGNYTLPRRIYFIFSDKTISRRGFSVNPRILLGITF